MISLQLRNSRRSQGATRKSEICRSQESVSTMAQHQEPNQYSCESETISTMGLLLFCREFRTIVEFVGWLWPTADYIRWNDLEHFVFLFYLHTFLVLLSAVSHTQSPKSVKIVSERVSFAFFEWSTSTVEQTTNASYTLPLHGGLCLEIFERIRVERTQFQCQHVHVQHKLYLLFEMDLT